MSDTLNRSEAAKALGVSLSTLDRLKAEGVIRESVHWGRVRRYDVEECRAALARHADSQRPQWCQEPTFSRAHLVIGRGITAMCGAKGSMAGWSLAIDEQPRCRRCLVIEQQKNPRP